MSTCPKILVATDTDVYAALVERLLKADFDDVVISKSRAAAIEELQSGHPTVLLLAFDSLWKSEAFYADIRTLYKRELSHRTLAFCNRHELEHVYELCKTRYFDDYILFSSVNKDTYRLQMAVHHALRQLSDTQDENIDHRTHSPMPIEGPDSPDCRGYAGHAVESPHRENSGEKRHFRGVETTILIVDDDEFQHKLLKRLLRDSGVAIVSSMSGSEALIALCEQPVDMILMDHELPDLSGIEVTRRIRQITDWTDIPVIMITGHSQKSVVMESLDAGADDFLVKPIRRKPLLVKLNSLLRGGI